MNKDELKDLRKAAFAVGFGLTFGKIVANILNDAIEGIGLGIHNFYKIKLGKTDTADISRNILKSKDRSRNDSENKLIGFRCY